MGPAIGVGDVADRLARMHVGTRQERHHRAGLVAGLDTHDAEVDAAPVETGRRAGLQPVDPQRQRPQAFGQRVGGRIARAATGLVLETHVDAAPEESAGGQHHAVGP